MDTTNAIRQARIANRLSLQKVADGVGVSKTTIHAWEQGRMLPHPRRVSALIKVLPGLTMKKIYAAAQTEAA